MDSLFFSPEYTAAGRHGYIVDENKGENGGKTMSELLKSVESCSKIISIKKQRKGWGMSETLFADLFRKGQPLLKVLPELLADHTTGKNIVWATDTYTEHGSKYGKEKQIFTDLALEVITDGTMLPRIQKTQAQQQARTRAKAEVFTPSWICNKMNNFCDDQWFGRKGVFNTENEDNTWTVNENKIDFGEATGKNQEEWMRYVDSKRIEITCGEAPYLFSRYDATTGRPLALKERIGILDRKMRVVNENTEDEKEWLKWAYRAFEACYGFEYQGDSLFFARVNMVQSFRDYYKDRFGKEPASNQIKKIANVASWNIWQMDGLKDTIPYGVPEDEYQQLSLFEEVKEVGQMFCKIKDWRSKKTIEYRSMKGA